MTKLSSKSIQRLLVLLPIIMLIGCATTKEPFFSSSSFTQKNIDKIYVLPVVDLRFNKEKKLKKLDKWVHSTIERQLKRKKYKVILIKDRSLVDTITEGDITEADPDWIRKLGPSDSKWIMLPALLDVSTRMTFGSTGNAEMSAALYDKQSGEVVWRDKAIGRMGQGGLVGMAMKGFMAQTAIETAIEDLMKSFPENIINSADHSAD